MSSSKKSWPNKKLAELVADDAPIVYGIVQAGPEQLGGVPYIKSSDVGGSISPSTLSLTSPDIAARYKRSTVIPGDIVFSLRGNIGEISIVPISLPAANLTQGTARIRPGNGVDGAFLSYALRSSKLQKKIAIVGKGSTFKEISLEELRKLEIPTPPHPTQQTISGILAAWDEALDKLEGISRSLERLRGALCQSLFEKYFAAENQLVRASKVFEAISERARPDLPLLAVMQNLGVVRRDELDRRVAMPDGDTSTYKVVRPGDFIISLRSFEGGIEYSDVLGLVSPAYTVLRPTRGVNSDYYRHFFKSRSFIGRLDKLIFGIRDGKQISFRDFGDMRIPNPSLEEQEALSKLLNEVAQQLRVNGQRRSALKAQKQGLMQKLLTGEWRVSNSGGES